jgi:hypothetical protein
MKQQNSHITLGKPLLGNSDPNALEKIIDQAEELINSTNQALDQINQDAQSYEQAYNNASGGGSATVPTAQTPTAAAGQSPSPMNHFWWVVGGITTAGVLIYLARQ